ncbi:ribosomal-protein-alanine N-acetyltransferase [Chitinophaga dinghuensis]|uniref:Ribosomal-protein-alanine N-acetyltransferase n=1 Tax=Chitinophaga dinghuensis TaxID=1539050 RepID=A0A327W848_9BACT|nr:GNAT family N-acetyltransferase [Chitinophaga dinghuensis]RAJ85638.1 ribosomal-protein-alanine N-acetyltransferase [Chitinophaga dinghuensis]
MLPLKTERLLVYPCRLPLLTRLYLGQAPVADDLDVYIPSGWPPEEMKEILPYFIEMLQHDPKSFPWLMWLIVSEKDKTLIGNVGFKGRPDKDGQAELSYYLLPPYRGRGYMKEAATALIDWAFSNSPVRRIVAECDTINIASLRVLQKIGMKLGYKSGDMLYWHLPRPQQS